jgi:hypothetical protein
MLVKIWAVIFWFWKELQMVVVGLSESLFKNEENDHLAASVV